MLTFGGAYSNHLAAAAALAAQEQIPIVGIVRGEELATKPLNPTLSQCQAKGMQLVFVSRAEYKQQENGKKVRQLVTAQNLLVVPEGGTNKLAVKWCMEILTNEDMRFELLLVEVLFYHFLVVCIQLGKQIPAACLWLDIETRLDSMV